MDYDHTTKIKLLHHLMGFVSDDRKKRFNEVLKYRTRHITVVLEDIYQPHNASAVLRTCDLTGIQDVHIIENKNQYNVNPEVALGSSKWLNLIKYNTKKNNTLGAYNSLKSNGYTIVATTPHKNAMDLDSLHFDKKIAIVFGTELKGLSDLAINSADEYVRIPMFGFTESYNISVSAAIVLFTLTQRLRNSNLNWRLDGDEITDILLDWARGSISKHDVIERHFVNNIP
ncbi:MAG: RNA methyltransferase [Bacteroidetes bacterium]|nr:RNA methyltransferase [Bacteroidota bacterium]